jgi:hypothetical protein
MYLALGLMFAGNATGVPITLNTMQGFHTYFQAKMSQQSVDDFLESLPTVFEKNEGKEAAKNCMLLQHNTSGGEGVSFSYPTKLASSTSTVTFKANSYHSQANAIKATEDAQSSAMASTIVASVQAAKDEQTKKTYKAAGIVTMDFINSIVDEDVLIGDADTVVNKLVEIHNAYTANALEVMEGNQEMKPTELEEVVSNPRWGDALREVQEGGKRRKASQSKRKGRI